MAFLRHVIQGVPHEYVLGTKTVIGRSSECDFAFPDQTISRKHCRIVRRGDRYCIRDLNSTAGTFVNSELLSEERVLRDGDCITIGPCTLEFVKGERRVSAGATERPADDGTTEPPTTLRIKKSIDSQGPFEIESIVPPQKKHMKRVQVLRDIKDQLSRLSHHATREELFSLTLEKVSSHLGGDRASILLRDERISQMKVVAITPPTKSGRRQFGVPARFEELVMADRKALLIQDAPRDERLKGSQSTVEQGIRSAVMAPLFLERECIGFIEVDSTTQSDLYDEYDLNFLSDVASQGRARAAAGRDRGFPVFPPGHGVGQTGGAPRRDRSSVGRAGNRKECACGRDPQVEPAERRALQSRQLPVVSGCSSRKRAFRA
jgi:pSer/pThr/pTyr-binding forkhead associated (FHA) protein